MLARRGYGFISAIRGIHGRRYGVAAPTALAPRWSLKDLCPPVDDQARTNSCVGHMLSAMVQMEEAQRGIDSGKPARLFIYWNGRAMANSTGDDGGCRIPDAVETLGTQGFCVEGTDPDQWAFDETKVTLRPHEQCYAAAKKHLIPDHVWVEQDLNDIKHCISVTQKPVGCGIAVYGSFESPDVARTGVVPMPGPSEDLMGEHAILIVAYDDAEGMFTCRNSWSNQWGQQGYFKLPYPFVAHRDLTSDLSTVVFKAA